MYRAIFKSFIVVMALATASFAVNVSVSAPSNGASVTSPATIRASASSGSIITGWHIYVDGANAYSGGVASSISVPVNMASGTHQVIIRAWDATGAYGSANMTVTVGGGATPAPAPGPAPAATSGGGPMPPSNAIAYRNVEQTNNWGKCSSASCSGGRVTGSYYAAGYQTTPSLDGASTMFQISGGAYSDDLFWVHPGNNPNPSHFITEWDVYTDANAPNLAEALEFDFVQVSGGRKYNFSSECNYATGTWDTWNEATMHWVHSNVKCTKFAPNAWHHVKWSYERAGAQTHYISITVDGVTYPIANNYAWQPAPATNWTNGSLIFQVQQDLNAKGGSFREWVDRANIYMW